MGYGGFDKRSTNSGWPLAFVSSGQKLTELVKCLGRIAHLGCQHFETQMWPFEAVSRVLCLSRDIDLLVSDTKAISEVNSKLGSNGRPEYLWPDPLGCNITKNEPDEFRCCLIAGEVSPQLHSLSNSTV